MIQDLMTGGASVGNTLTLGASSLQAVQQRLRPLFTPERVAASAGQFLDALLGNEPHKTSWMRAEAAGDSGPWRQQALLGRGRWQADARRDVVRNYVVEHLSDEDAVLVIDETDFLKQGKASCGLVGNTRAPLAKLPTAKLGCSRPMYPPKALLSLTAYSTCRKPGHLISPECGLLMCQRRQRSPPSLSWLLAWLRAPSPPVLRFPGWQPRAFTVSANSK